MKRRTLLKAFTGLAVAGLTYDQIKAGGGPHLTGLASCPEDLPTSANLRVADPSQIKLLQFTDTHLYRWPWRSDLDQRTRDDMFRMVDQHQPDLVLMTGDLWHNNPLHLGAHYLDKGLAIFRELGVPWLFTWGNHDRLDDYLAGHRALTAAPHSLYRGGKTGGCYTVQLQDRQGQPLWDLVCLNTNGYGVGPAQKEWATSLRLTAPHVLAVFHIPLLQQRQLWEAGQGTGVGLEKVGSGVEDGSALTVLGNLKVNYCISGHDHVNDFSVLSRVGGCPQTIELIYGRATGYSGYGQEHVPKGAKLYHLNALTGKVGWASVLADGTRWVPQSKMHVDHWRPDLWKS